MKMNAMRIGQVARQSGVNIQTVRYYERRRLLSEPGRSPSGYREYGPEAVRLIRFVKRAQELGFTLAEVEELLKLRGEQASCPEVRGAAATKIEVIRWKIKGLLAMKRALEVLVQSCDSNGSTCRCPILETLDSGDIPLASGGETSYKTS